MPITEWPKPPKRRGRTLTSATMKFEPAFLDALRRYSLEESDRTGSRVSQATILATTALCHNKELRRLYRSARTSSADA